MENFRCAIQLFLDYFIFKNGQILSNYLSQKNSPGGVVLKRCF